MRMACLRAVRLSQERPAGHSLTACHKERNCLRNFSSEMDSAKWVLTSVHHPRSWSPRSRRRSVFARLSSRATYWPARCQVALFYNGIRPYGLHEFVFADKPAVTLNEHAKRVEHLGSKFERLAAAEQTPFRAIQAKKAELVNFAGALHAQLASALAIEATIVARDSAAPEGDAILPFHLKRAGPVDSWA